MQFRQARSAQEIESLMASINQASATQRAFGRGFHEGARKAKAEFEAENMNKRRMASIIEGLNSALRKTFDLVPAESPWTAAQIFQEAKRIGQCATLQDTKGRLSSLVERGVVIEPERGKFLRTRAKDDAPRGSDAAGADDEEVEQVAKEPEQQAKPAAKTSIDDDLIGIAEDLRAIAARIDAAAVKAAEQMESVSSDTKKLRQLQDILKSIGAA